MINNYFFYLFITLLFFGIGDFLGVLTKAKVSSVFVSLLLFLVCFMTGIIPADTIKLAGLSEIGSWSALFIIFSMGTSINLREFISEWRTVVTAVLSMLVVMASAVIMIPLVGYNETIVSVPIINGGIVATQIMTTAAMEKGLTLAAALGTIVYAVQKFFGTPFASYFGIREARWVVEELRRTAAPCRRDGKVIAAHIRDDAAQVVPAARELLEAGRVLGVSAQVSHIGSMGGFGQMRELLRLVDGYRIGGLNASCDCYPYTAFSTMIGSTTYDDGWRERYGCGYDAVEICEGKYRGQRCTEEIFNEVRRDNPECLTVCYVMAENDIDMAMAHPNVMLASDGIMNHGQGHPRAAGAFPRLFAEYVRTGKLPLYEAVRMATIMPAEKLGLKSKGRLTPGADADVIVFAPEKIADRATFMEPTLPPVGIDGVWIGGRLAAKDCRIVNGSLGRSVRK